MYLRSVVLCVILSSFLGQNFSYILDKTTTQSECENICAASTGQAEFNEETKICKCRLSKRLDDVDVALINKNAKLIVDKTENKATITKRDVVETPTENPVSTVAETEVSTVTDEETAETDTKAETDTSAETYTKPETIIGQAVTDEETVETETNPDTDTDPETIVGQAAPRRSFQRGVVTPRRQREPRPITVEQQRMITQQITDHVNHLAQLTDQRLRDMEIEAIKNNLRQLSNTVVAPQPRSRLRNVVEESRRRPRPRLLHSRLVAAPAPFPNFNENSAEKLDEVNGAIKEIFHGKRKHEIITQDPRLIDE